MRLRWAGLLLAGCGLPGMAADDPVAACPAPAKEVLASCREITYSDLPEGARALLKKLKCDVRPGSNYNWGSSVDLNGDGSPEYQFCCHEAPHGPCGAVLIGRVGGQWKDLTAKDGLLGFDGACKLLVVLESRHGEFRDVCLPAQCSPTARAGACTPAIWQYDGTRYRAGAGGMTDPKKAR